VPHDQGTAEPPGPAGPVGSASLAGAAGPALWLIPGPEHPSSREHNLDEHDSLRNAGLIKGWRLALLENPLLAML
jgi:hypothetical protein